MVDRDRLTVALDPGTGPETRHKCLVDLRKCPLDLHKVALDLHKIALDLHKVALDLHKVALDLDTWPRRRPHRELMDPQGVMFALHEHARAAS